MNNDLKKLSEGREIEISNVLRIVRPTMGPDVGLGLYRLLRFVAMEEMLGRGASGVAYLTGKKLGRSLGLDSLDACLEFCAGIKLGRIEVPIRTDTELRIDVHECATCAGMETIGRPLCHFEGGLLAGMVETALGKSAKANEVCCIGGLGDPTCSYDITLSPAVN